MVIMMIAGPRIGSERGMQADEGSPEGAKKPVEAIWRAFDHCLMSIPTPSAARCIDALRVQRVQQAADRLAAGPSWKES
jgi:hypothetical protein